jgi:chromosome segregation ATPase
MIAHKPPRRFLVAACCCLAAMVNAPRARAVANTFKEAAGLRNITAKASHDIGSYAIQLDKTEQALSSVSQAGGRDIKKRYKSFSGEVNKLQKRQRHATAAINAMRSTGRDYFTSWNTLIAQMSNPELRQASTERRSKLMKDHDEVAANLSDIGRDLRPFMSNLQDLRAFLGADLSPANIDKAGTMIQKSQTDAQGLRDKIADVQRILSQFLSETPR